jgi:hypothetical protein
MEYSITKFIKTLRLSDLILVGICLVAAVLVYRSLASETTKLYIYKGEQLFGIYSLQTDRSIVIDEHNTVVISGGKAAISFSDCPDKRCMKQGYNRSLPIICLPNRLVLEFKSSDADRKLILQ